MAIWNERIKALRLSNDITLAEIAEHLSVAEATAQRYESGSIKTIPYEHIENYANIFGVSPCYIMGWQDSPNIMNESPCDDSGINQTLVKLNDVNKKKVDSYAKKLLSIQEDEDDLN